MDKLRICYVQGNARLFLAYKWRLNFGTAHQHKNCTFRYECITRHSTLAICYSRLLIGRLMKQESGVILLPKEICPAIQLYIFQSIWCCRISWYYFQTSEEIYNIIIFLLPFISQYALKCSSRFLLLRIGTLQKRGYYFFTSLKVLMY